MGGLALVALLAAVSSTQAAHDHPFVRALVALGALLLSATFRIIHSSLIEHARGVGRVETCSRCCAAVFATLAADTAIVWAVGFGFARDAWAFTPNTSQHFVV